jgi:hypothetical protein
MALQYIDDLAALNKDGGDHIRVLRVHSPSSRPKDATFYELCVFPLRHAPIYSASSYCRQPGDEIVNIDVRGSAMGSFPISHDLRSATRAVHHHGQTDWLWIDAICINQSSNDEKNDQVPRMREVYEMAYACFIWLGGAPQREEVGSGDTEDATIFEPGFAELRYASLGLPYRKVVQLAKLARTHRVWWCRTWFIQEMILPLRLYVCIGMYMMRWDQFVSTCYAWDSSGHNHDLNEATAKLKKLDELRRQWQSAKYSLDILELLQLGRESYATDARDNVYGILGLANMQDKQHIRVDYGRAVGQVYAETTVMLIKKYRSIDFVVGSF